MPRNQASKISAFDASLSGRFSLPQTNMEFAKAVWGLGLRVPCRLSSTEIQGYMEFHVRLGDGNPDKYDATLSQKITKSTRQDSPAVRSPVAQTSSIGSVRKYGSLFCSPKYQNRLIRNPKNGTPINIPKSLVPNICKRYC